MTLEQAVKEATELATGSRDFFETFDESLQAAGFTYVGGDCTCVHEGKNGHDWACGWAEKVVDKKVAK